jgi:hypothetical protein
MTIQEDWNPDTASEEMAALFAEADRIMQQPHYQHEDASGDELETRTADTLPTTEQIAT